MLWISAPRHRRHVHPAVMFLSQNCCAMIARRSPRRRWCWETSGGGGVNVQGERQTPMDVFADTLLNDALRPLAKTLASEEADAVIAGSPKWVSRRVSTPSTRRRAVDSLVDWHTGVAGSGRAAALRSTGWSRLIASPVALLGHVQGRVLELATGDAHHVLLDQGEPRGGRLLPLLGAAAFAHSVAVEGARVLVEGDLAEARERTGPSWSRANADLAASVEAGRERDVDRALGEGARRRRSSCRGRA